MKPELRYCPCCGSSDVHYIGFIGPEKEGYYIKCFGCDYESLITETEEEAAELWNYGGCFDKCNNHDAIANLSNILKGVYEQRDAALADLRKCAYETDHECYYCKHYNDEEREVCNGCDVKASKWEWRGVDI